MFVYILLQKCQSSGFYTITQSEKNTQPNLSRPRAKFTVLIYHLNNYSIQFRYLNQRLCVLPCAFFFPEYALEDGIVKFRIYRCIIASGTTLILPLDSVVLLTKPTVYNTYGYEARIRRTHTCITNQIRNVIFVNWSRD